MPIIQVVDFASFQQCNCLTPNLIRGPVIQVELSGAATNVDATAAHGCTVPAVDALMPITDKEKVIRTTGNHCP